MKPKIVIQVEGGCVTFVHASEDIDVEIIDHDSQDESDDDSELLAEEATKGMLEIY